MLTTVGIIGGTGIGPLLSTLGGELLQVPTAKGTLEVLAIDEADLRIVLMRRHGPGHQTPPHEVAYEAMALGLRELGAQHCFASAAVGSLRSDWGPGTIAVCSDFIDLTGRNITLFEHEVIHTDFTEPFGIQSREALVDSAAEMKLEIESKAVYINVNGPRYETPAEVRMQRILGGDIVGMTAGSEAVVMKEAGIDYACVAVVSNLASGLGGAPLSHGEVVDVMEHKADTIVALLRRACKGISDGG